MTGLSFIQKQTISKKCTQIKLEILKLNGMDTPPKLLLIRLDKTSNHSTLNMLLNSMVTLDLMVFNSISTLDLNTPLRVKDKILKCTPYI
jgi:hypothetical protein